MYYRRLVLWVALDTAEPCQTCPGASCVSCPNHRQTTSTDTDLDLGWRVSEMMMDRYNTGLSWRVSEMIIER